MLNGWERSTVEGEDNLSLLLLSWRKDVNKTFNLLDYKDIVDQEVLQNLYLLTRHNMLYINSKKRNIEKIEDFRKLKRARLNSRLNFTKTGTTIYSLVRTMTTIDKPLLRSTKRR